MALLLEDVHQCTRSTSDYYVKSVQMALIAVGVNLGGMLSDRQGGIFYGSYLASWYDTNWDDIEYIKYNCIKYIDDNWKYLVTH